MFRILTGVQEELGYLVHASSRCQAFQNVLMMRGLATTGVHHNSNRTAVTRINRHNYAQMYPTVLVMSDGSTVTVRHKIPRAIIKLPLDLATLSDAERALRLAKRKPARKVVVEEDFEDSFDANQYSHLWKKKD
jgi:large subunit ribosomal protein L55